jgi:hypothetical protein
MKIFVHFIDKFTLFLGVAILILCIGFIFISCGKSPQVKVEILDNGPYSIDLTQSTGGGGFNIDSPNFTTVNGRPFTVEAWVKRKAQNIANFNGFVFSQLKPEVGFALLVEQSKPKFTIRFPTMPTSTDYAVACNPTVDLPEDEWAHVAGSLVYENHSQSQGHPACPDKNQNSTGGESEIPHLDLFVNGTICGCATINELDAEDIPLSNEGTRVGKIGYSDGGFSAVTSTAPFIGNIDEVRLWVNTTGGTAARSASEISQCFNRELDVSSASCSFNKKLAGYWPLNFGSGVDAYDISGHVLQGLMISQIRDVNNAVIDLVEFSGYWELDSQLP